MCSNCKLKGFLSLVELPVSRCTHTMIVKVAMELWRVTNQRSEKLHEGKRLTYSNFFTHIPRKTFS